MAVKNPRIVPLFRRSRTLDRPLLRRVIASAGRLGFVLLVAHRFEPFHVLAVLGFLHGEVLHAVLGRGAVPVLLVRRNPDRVAGPDLADRTAPGLHMADAGDDVQSLPERMGMPERARARLEAHPAGAQQRGIGRLDDRILPHRSGEGRCRASTRGPRSASDDVHNDLLPKLHSDRMVYFEADLSTTAACKKPGVAAGLSIQRSSWTLGRLQIARRLLAALGADLVAPLLAFA